MGHRSRTATAATAASLVLGAVSVVAPSSASAVEADAPPPTALFIVDDPEINEASGVAVGSSGRVLWTHEDANNPPVVTALDATGQTVARVELQGVANEDWEDIAVAEVDGRPWVYVADTGDAFFARRDADLPFRTEYEIARFPEPDLQEVGDEAQVEAETTLVIFPDDETVNVEAIAVAPDGAVLLVEKVEPPPPPEDADDADAQGGDGEDDEPPPPDPARVWRIPDPQWADTSRPELVGQMPLVGVSGADMDRAGERFAVRTADTASVFAFDGGQPDFDDLVASVALPSQQQGESIAFTAQGDALVVGSEGSRQAMWFVPLSEGLTPGLRPPPVDAAVASIDAELASPEDWSGLVIGAIAVALVALAGLVLALVRSRRSPWIESQG